jgi:uncharacterized lipoprotein YddW (UPF0748 family)
MWVTRWDYHSAHDVRALVANCAGLGLNRIYFQVRGRADSFYRSGLEPWGEELLQAAARGGGPGFDPLAVALEAAQKLGVELHAWVNVLCGWKGANPPADPRHLVHQRPEWFLREGDGLRGLCRRDRYTLLNPALLEVRRHVARVVSDIAARYAVDGIQLDYVRLLAPRPAPGQDREPDAEAFDALVREIAAAIRGARPRARISLAALPDFDDARERLFQDAPGWLARGWIDEVSPMLYTADERQLASWIAEWRATVPAARLVAGLGLFRLPEPRGAAAQIERCRRERLAGFSLFSYPACFLSRSPHSRSDGAAAERRAGMRKAVASRAR